MYLKELIRTERQKAGLTQQQLADRAGVTRVAITHYEQGKRTPELYPMLNICYVLNINLDDLIKCEGNQE